jgi:adenylate cyclase, class 2
MRETETKILGVNPRTIAARLKKLGARQTQKTRLVVDWYRLKGVTEGTDPWFLRIRTGTGKSEVTWKAHSKILGASRSHKEINLDVPSHELTGQLFESIGLEHYAHQEKDRTSWNLKRWSFDLDQYPNMPAYLEIEAPSEKSIQAAITLLDLTGHRAMPEGERTLIQREYGLDWYNMRF